jgi:hypothetical protein
MLVWPDKMIAYSLPSLLCIFIFNFFLQVITPLPSHIPQCKAQYDFRMTNDDEEGCLTFNKVVAFCCTVCVIVYYYCVAQFSASVCIFLHEYRNDKNVQIFKPMKTIILQGFLLKFCVNFCLPHVCYMSHPYDAP